MQEVVFIVEEAQEGGFTAKCIAESIFTQGETLEGLKEAIIDAVHCHFDDDQKRIIRLQIVREEVIDA
jgi:predicted RNase H-like HicB family nuclease